MIALTVNSERDLRQVCDRNIAQSGVSCGEDIRIQSIPYACLCKSDSAFYTLGEKSLLRSQVDKDAVLYGEDRVGDLAGGAGNEIPRQLTFCKGFILCQRMRG